MANPEHLEILKQGVKKWNEWRKEISGIMLDLSDADLRYAILCGAFLGGADLSGTILRGADLGGANLIIAKLSGAKLIDADLSGADLSGADLIDADLSGADLIDANLSGADLIDANLSGAKLSGANLRDANLRDANLRGANLRVADLRNTLFANVNLSETKGLESCQHHGPSTIGIDTIYKSQGKIPEEFLRGCGVDENFIRFIPSLVGAVQPFQLYSCFISHSTKDVEFAQRLHSRLRDAKARVWFSPEDVKGGEKLFDQLERAIQLHDRLLLILSEESLKSGWVETEIRKAIETEKREGRRKLFPIRITDFDTIKKWRCFDAETGKDLAVEVREYFIPDFSNWKDHDSFEAAFDRLLRDLKAEEKP
ncbi:MAG: toll/interleukin-1 receptor domain-containing protein [Acidobacteria bacterium]|nr:toll/interleukin-1 receptor domain-containing protein [Acidobacteriota bacterium]